MPLTPHIERHFTATATVRDIVIGMSDGLTVPSALAAGFSGAVAFSSLAVSPVGLFVFGYVKSGFTGISPWRGGGQTAFVGGLAAAAAFGIARLIG